MASTGKRSAQDLTGVDGDVLALEGNGWVVVRTTDGAETLRVQQRYLEKRPKEHSEVMVPALQDRNCCTLGHGLPWQWIGIACKWIVRHILLQRSRQHMVHFHDASIFAVCPAEEYWDFKLLRFCAHHRMVYKKQKALSLI